jgi:O-antigen/teichoic acid export membrane protein
MLSNHGTSLYRKTIYGLIIMFSGATFQSIIQIILTIMLARLLTPSDYGIVGMALVIISFVNITSTLGVGPAIIQKHELSEDHISTAFSLTLLVNVFFTIGLYNSSHLFASFFNTAELEFVLKGLSFTCIIYATSIIAESLLLRKLEFKKIVFINAISNLLYAITSVSLAYLDYGYLSLVIAYMIQSMIRSILMLIYSQHLKRIRINFIALKELTYYGGGHSLSKFFNQMAIQGDNFIIGRFLGSDALGIYSRVYQLLVFPANVFGKVLDSVLFPAMSKVQDNTIKLTMAYMAGTRFISTIVFPFSIVVCMISTEIVNILFGANWTDLITPLQILSMGMVFRTSYKIGDSISKAKGAVYQRAWRQFIYFSCVILGSIIGQNWGVSGVCYGVLCAISINYLLMAQLSLNLLQSSWKKFILTQSPSVVIAIIIFFETTLVVNVMRDSFQSPIVIIVVSFVCFMVVFLTIILIFPKYFTGLSRGQMMEFKNKYVKNKH